MRNFLSANLFLICILLFGSCKKDFYDRLEGEEKNIIVSELKKPIPNDTTCIYKTGVDAYGQYISGLLIIKSLKEDDYRLVFTTEMGLKLFDFEFDDGEFIVHYCMQKLNKKPVISLLEKDFSLLLGRNMIGENMKFGLGKHGPVFYRKVENEIWAINTTAEGRFMSVVTYSEKGKDKLTILYKIDDQIPENISLEHQNLNLKIGMKLLE